MVAIAVEESPNVADMTSAFATIEIDEEKPSKELEEPLEEQKPEAQEESDPKANLNAGNRFASWNATLIGEGAFGSVLLVVNDDGRKLAVKRIPVKYDAAMKQTVEYEFMEELKGHENVVQSFGMELEGAEFIHISMEYVCYDLHYLTKYINHGNVRHFFRQLIEGVRHIHSRGIAHRDIKPENLLINEKFVLKITDFGLAERFRDKENNEVLLTGTAGTSPYVSPEGRCDEGFHAEPHDIFACGVVLLFLLTGNTHWDKADPIEDLRYKKFLSGAMYQEKSWKVIQGNAVSRWRFIVDLFHEPFSALLKRVLKDKPDRRATIEEILRSGWVMEEEERLNWDRLRNGIKKVYATPVPNEQKKEEQEEFVWKPNYGRPKKAKKKAKR